MRLACRLALLATCLALPRAAAAQGRHASEEAIQIFEGAVRQEESGNFMAAGELFERVFELTEEPAPAYNAARCYDVASSWPKALALYDRWLATSPPEALVRRLVIKLVVSGKEAAAAHEHDLAIGRLELARRLGKDSSPGVAFDLAAVLEEAGRSAEALRLYRRSLELGHHSPARSREAIERLEAVLYKGRLKLKGLPAGAVVLLDSMPFDPGPEGVLVAAGEHEVSVEAEGHQPWTGLVQLAPGGDAEILVDMPRLPAVAAAPPPAPAPVRWTRVTAWTTTGLAAAAAGAGLVLFLMGRSSDDETASCRSDPACGSTSALAASEDEARARYLLSTASIASAGALATASGLLWWISSAGEAGPAGEGPTPVAGLAGGGFLLLLEGRF